MRGGMRARETESKSSQSDRFQRRDNEGLYWRTGSVDGKMPEGSGDIKG